MSVPLDKLYDFLNDQIDQDIVIYRWWPHGSKFLKDLRQANECTQFQRLTSPIIICHDQEPLNFTQYTYEDIVNAPVEASPEHWASPILKNKLVRLVDKTNPWGQQFLNFTNLSLYDGYVLLHSEKNSKDVEKYYNSGAAPAYYWSHAVIASDWFRYAKIDPSLTTCKNITKDFLVYNRAWSGTREYRLKFSELVIQYNLHQSCHMNFSVTDSEKYYQNHVFKNINFKTSINNIESYFTPTRVDSNASADYNSKDYNSCLIEVVLETMFDSKKIHLTEKSLRPIVCKMPFIIAAGPGSLKYLKDYGFKTFDSLWDESYDTIVNPVDRLNAIIHLMKKISLLSDSDKQNLYRKSLDICEHNHRLFFSDAFFNGIITELKQNVNYAINQLPKSKERLLNTINNSITAASLSNKLDLFYKEILSTSVINDIRNLE